MKTNPISPRAFQNSFGTHVNQGKQPAFGSTVLDELRDELAAQNPDVFHSSTLEAENTSPKKGKGFLERILSIF